MWEIISWPDVPPKKRRGSFTKCSPPDLDRTCTGLAPDLFQAGRGKCELTGVVYPREREVGKRMLKCVMCNIEIPGINIFMLQPRLQQFREKI